MTNFDKWKEGLKPEDLIRPRLIDAGRTRCVCIQCSANCPAAASCPAGKAFPKNIERWRHFGAKCDKWFLRWADAPAKEDE